MPPRNGEEACRHKCSMTERVDDEQRVAEFLLEYPMPPHTKPNRRFLSSSNMSISEPGPSTFGSGAGPSPGNASLGILDEVPMTQQEEDLFSISRSHYDAKEHERVDYLLRYSTHPKARFLGLYCKYLVSGLVILHWTAQSIPPFKVQ